MESITSTKEAVAVGGIIGGMFATVGIIALAMGVLGIIAGWKIFTKAGEKGWKVLIPVYNLYIAFKIVGMNFWGWFCASLVCSLCLSLFGGYTVTYDASGNMTSLNMNGIGWVFFIASVVITVAMNIIYAYRLAKSFKKGGGFAAGIFFLPFIFTLILAFGSAKYDKKAALKK